MPQRMRVRSEIPMCRYLFAVLLIWPLSLSGQLISVRSEVESDSLMIGDQVVYSLLVEARDNVELSLPEIKDTLSSELEVLTEVGSDTTISDGMKQITRRFLITSFEGGVHMIPAQPVPYATGTITDTALSMPVMVRVYEPEVDLAGEIKPIKPPINTPLTFMEILPWMGLGLAAMIIGIPLTLWIRKIRQRKEDPEGLRSKPLEPAHVAAFRELDRLKEAKLWEKGEVKLFYIRLSNIVREYVEQQYSIPAMESTTSEILSNFHRFNREDNLLDEMLQELLEMADLVKFAKEDPPPVDNQTNLNNAYLFVQKTYPLFYREEVTKNLEVTMSDE